MARMEAWFFRGLDVSSMRSMGILPMFSLSLFLLLFLFLCHSRESGNPVFFFFTHIHGYPKSLDSRFRGNDTGRGIGYWLFNGHWVFGHWSFFSCSKRLFSDSIFLTVLSKSLFCLSVHSICFLLNLSY